MRGPSTRTRAQVVATLAALQTGIEPATLTLLVANHAVSPADFGWIVSVGQVGMVGGALLGWRQSRRRRRTPALIGPAIGVAASLAMMVAHGLITVLVLRLVLGIIMGLILTHATARAARHRPHNAIGIILLAQQLLSTTALAGLPAIAAAWGPAAALGTLAAAPLLIAWLTVQPEAEAAAPPAPASNVAITPAAADGNALVPMALIAAVTLMLWSYVATIGAALGVHEAGVAYAIAVSSLASAPAAALAAFSGPRLPPWLTALVCGAGIVSFFFVPGDAGLSGYLVALILFNAGSTFGVIRFTAWAMRAPPPRRHFVAMAQCVAMSAGPAVGAVAMRLGGLPTLAALAIAGVVAAIILPFIRKIDRVRRPALDVALTA